MPAVISTGALTKRYGETVAVDGVSIQVRQGEIYALLGVNGAGKSTTIRMLLGMVRPSSGSVLLFGRPLRRSDKELWARTGYLVERPTAYPDLTVRQNVEVVRRLRGIVDRNAVDRALNRLGLFGYAERRAGSLSTGNLQRLGLAKALLSDPDLLILDEPTSSLDPAGIVEIRELLRDLAENNGVAVFISSHILAEVSRLATRVGIIHHGRLVEEIEPNRLHRRRLVVDTRDRAAARRILATNGFNIVREGSAGELAVIDQRAVERPDDIAELLVDEGTPPTAIRVERDDLESHFLRLIRADGREPR
jgi:ABC-2 type transport system ATP-binding protein